MATRDKGMSRKIGPMEIDVPRTAGYYGGVAAAVAFGLIEWPVAIFIGAIPMIRLMRGRRLPGPVQFAVHLLDGAAQPVGGDAEGTLQLNRMPASVTRAANAVGAAANAVGRTFSARPVSPRRRAATAKRATARKSSTTRSAAPKTASKRTPATTSRPSAAGSARSRTTAARSTRVSSTRATKPKATPPASDSSASGESSPA